MKKYLNLLFFLLTINLKKTQRNLKTTLQKSPTPNKTPRKAMFTPYMDVFEDYGAKPVGAKQFEGQNYMAASPVGVHHPNTSSLIPGGFSGGYTIPGASTPFAHLGMASMGNLQNQTTALLNPYSNQQNQGMGMGAGLSSGGISPGNGALSSGGRGLLSLPELNVQENCDNVKSQAISIANEVLKKEYKYIFKIVNSYLVKNKFLIGMTEVKMTRNLRKKMAGIMQMFANVTPQNIMFSGTGYDSLTDKDFSDLLTKNDLVEGDDLDHPTVDQFIHKI